MNYRSHFKKSSGKIFLPEGVDTEQLKQGIRTEKEHTKDVGIAAKIALDHLKEDPKYYDKLSQAGLEEDHTEEPMDTPDHEKTGWEADAEIGKMQADPSHRPSPFDKVDENDGLPTLDGALAIPHIGQPIHMSKIISVGGLNVSRPDGQTASGDLSGYTSMNKGVTKDAGGIPATSEGDKEPITAGGHEVSNDIATKSVGGEVVPGKGQTQGGPNTKGTIANTAKLNESKQRIRRLVTEVLKEIKFDKASGKWVKINENTVDMKMGPSYKVANRQYRTQDDDQARTVQYDPEITEMCDDEEIAKMESRISELATTQRTLSESELAELNKLSVKMEGMGEDEGLDFADGDEPERQAFQRGIDKYNRRNPQRFECPTCKTPNALSADQKRKGYQCDRCADSEEGTGFGMEESSYKVASPTQARVSDDDQARTIQTEPEMTEDSDFGSEDDLGLGDENDVAGDAGACPECGNTKGNIGMGQTAQCARCGTDYTPEHEEAPESAVHAFDPEMTDTQLGQIGKLDVATEPELSDDELAEAAGGVAQHRSFRTVADLPQKKDARWSDEIDESADAKKEPKESETAKLIKKGQKSKKSLKPDQLKHQIPRTSKSGVHKKDK